MRRRALTDLPTLAQRLRDGDQRALARAISLVESGASERDRLMELLSAPPSTEASHPDLQEQTAHHQGARNGWVIGVTGPPGVGKSTLIGNLIMSVRAKGERVAVLAVDPTSPFSGGALLGDRVRMNLHGTDPGVFIRSMASAGHSGGLSPSAVETVTLLHAAGYGTVIVESVGVGQSEIGILTLADLVLVVLQPGAGDEIQALKAGVLEIGDIFVVNKAEQPGSDALIRALNEMVANSNRSSLTPEVTSTVALDGTGIEELYSSLLARFAELSRNGELRERRQQRLVGALEEMAVDLFKEWIARKGLTDPRGGVPFATLRRSLSELLEALEERRHDKKKP